MNWQYTVEKNWNIIEGFDNRQDAINFYADYDDYNKEFERITVVCVEDGIIRSKGFSYA